MTVVDTHVHVVSPDATRYPRRPYGDSAWIDAYAGDAGEYAALMAANGVGWAVLVQAVGAYTDDNRYCIDAARADPARFTAVAYVDLHGDDPVAALERWATAGAHGVRIVVAAGENPVRATDPKVADCIARAGELDVRVLLTTLADGMADVAGLLERFPGVPFAIDHCGFPDLTGGPPYPRAGALFALAALPTVQCKVSTNALDCARRAGGDPRDFVAALAGSFGPSRLQWGSDWSHTHDRPFDQLVSEAHAAFSVLDPRDREWPLGRAALGFWPGWS